MTLNSVQLTYFNIAGKPSTAALGENINLLLKDAGVDYTYRRISNDEWKDIKEDLIKKNVACPTAPFVEVDGKILTKSVPAMRYLSKKLGLTVGKTDEEQYALESVADVVRDHLAAVIKLFRSEDAQLIDEHFQNNSLKYLKAYDVFYGENAGPYYLGEQISYVDYLVYHIIDDDFDAINQLKDFPNVRKFVDAFVQRPALAEYLANAKKSQ